MVSRLSNIQHNIQYIIPLPVGQVHSIFAVFCLLRELNHQGLILQLCHLESL